MLGDEESGRGFAERGSALVNCSLFANETELSELLHSFQDPEHIPRAFPFYRE